MDTLQMAVETCPVCDGADTLAAEPGWFVIELDRGDEIRVEFRCRDCGSAWN